MAIQDTQGAQSPGGDVHQVQMTLGESGHMDYTIYRIYLIFAAQAPGGNVHRRVLLERKTRYATHSPRWR